GWKKLFQTVPDAGILFGAIANRSMVNGAAETGMMMYKKRWIMERLAELDAAETE
ncbi:EcsC family protein, partial [Bacillus sp. GbtcB13]|uniref:EcsC family protein n=1 Tax=Bacillus sp. GbtcB13 TaxID=2824758 RepID=UPI001C2FF8B9